MPAGTARGGRAGTPLRCPSPSAIMQRMGAADSPTGVAVQELLIERLRLGDTHEWGNGG